MATIGFGFVRVFRPLLRRADARVLFGRSSLLGWGKESSPTYITKPFVNGSCNIRYLSLSTTNHLPVPANNGTKEPIPVTSSGGKKKLQRKKRTIIDRDDEQISTNPVLILNLQYTLL